MIPLSNHLKARFLCTRQAFKVTGGAALVENYSWYGAESPQALAWSDANRELDHLDRYSGMGGFCSQTQIWWHYQFSEEEVLVLPIHVTKMWAELVTAALNGVECSGLRHLEYVDNEGS